MKYIPVPTYWNVEEINTEFIEEISRNANSIHWGADGLSKWEAWWILSGDKVTIKLTDAGYDIKVRKSRKVVGQYIAKDPIEAALCYNEMEHLFNRKNGQRRF